jgi:hypothetical protein
MKRSDFLKFGIFSATGSLMPSLVKAHIHQANEEVVDKEIIKEFVTAGHNDLSTVKKMLAEEPNLVYARHDWGGGDFEEAIEGAGHVGNREIAEYLIQAGARVNLFVLSMLGKNKIVIPALQEYPGLIYSIGPHGFSLLHHAKIGGDSSREIYSFLIEQGLEETKLK